MAWPNDPEVVRFVNEVVRPLCEKARALKVLAVAMDAQWSAGLNAIVPQNSTVLDDGRATEGVSRLTGQNITDVIYHLTVQLTALNDGLIDKPCVRPLQVE